MRSARREAPNVDVGLVATAYSLGLPAGAASAVFAVARTAGWLAHAFEQREAGWVMRPRARYVGE
jgi:citrate synthase